MQNLLNDFRYALRQLQKSPVFTFTAVLTLALGIGANTAIFTVVQSLLLAPLDYPEADRIMALNTRYEQQGRETPRVTGADLVDIRNQSKSVSAIGYYQGGGGEAGVQIRDHSSFTAVSAVDAGFARVLQVAPEAGRWFVDSEAKHAAVVNANFARDHFGGVQAAIGQTIAVEGQPVQIVGVLPAAFDFPDHTQVWMAEAEQPQTPSRTAFNYRAVVRLRHGVSMAAAQSELTAIASRLQSAYPGDNKDKTFRLVPLQEQLVGSVRPMLLLLMASVALILLIACVNVMHLYMARAVDRQRELAVRTALGSTRSQLGRLVVVESLLVSFAGAIVGIFLAIPLVKMLVRIAPANLPRSADIHLNFGVLAFTAGIALLATVAASLLPARQATRVDPIVALKQDSSRGMSSRHSSRLRSGLVVAEVAATFVLAFGAALLGRTMLVLQNTDPGYRKSDLLIVDADAPASTLESSIQATQKFETIFAELRALPGVESVGGVMGLPTGSYGSNGYYGVIGAPYDVQHGPQAVFTLASPDYFRTMAVPLLSGRDFTRRDDYDAPPVAIVSESLARQSFPGQDPIGRQIECGLDAPGKWMTIVGVVRDLRQDSPADAPGPALYMPLLQHPSMAAQINIAIHTRLSPVALIDTVRGKIERVDPAIAARFTTMNTMVGDSVEMQHFRSILIGSFAAVGLLLAVLGVYGTVAYSVAQRTFEVGIRMTFGAERASILKLVLLQVLMLAGIGVGAGLMASLIAGHWIGSMLVGVSPADPVSLAIAIGVLLSAALLAAFLPARRAALVDPVKALRGL
ncbi:Permease [Acidisarcina polymorpha]|uniref:Permease n=1 Tax=Acidisarcina polymorpha TaxID=2211140 RepID=A0A2Z5FW49_9BACT|nr:ABC transporter permease [Acidisarcina polymorpha]AXC11113.1 Permease [Acidisarcina polymorpha]